MAPCDELLDLRGGDIAAEHDGDPVLLVHVVALLNRLVPTAEGLAVGWGCLHGDEVVSVNVDKREQFVADSIDVRLRSERVVNCYGLFGFEGAWGSAGAVQGPCESGGSLGQQIREPLWNETLGACARCWWVFLT